MANKLLDSHKHYCFHSPVGNFHTHPSLNHCLDPDCPGAISTDMARQAGYVDADGNIKCPVCDCDTAESGERKVFEVHAKLCTDETIHYPEMRKSGKISEDQYQAWKATLTRDELLGRYKRVPDIHVTVQLHNEEAALIDTDLDAFNTLLQQRLHEKAEKALLFQAPHRHQTTKADIKL